MKDIIKLDYILYDKILGLKVLIHNVFVFYMQTNWLSNVYISFNGFVKYVVGYVILNHRKIKFLF